MHLHLHRSIDPRQILLGLFFQTLGLIIQCHSVIREQNPNLPIFKQTLLHPVNSATICHKINRRRKNVVTSCRTIPWLTQQTSQQVTQKSYLAHSWHLDHCSLLVIQTLNHAIMICQGHGKIEFIWTNHVHCKNLKENIQRKHTIYFKKTVQLCVEKYKVWSVLRSRRLALPEYFMKHGKLYKEKLTLKFPTDVNSVCDKALITAAVFRTIIRGLLSIAAMKEDYLSNWLIHTQSVTTERMPYY